MVDFSRQYPLTINADPPTGNTIYQAIDKIDDELDYVMTSLEALKPTLKFGTDYDQHLRIATIIIEDGTDADTIKVTVNNLSLIHI